MAVQELQTIVSQLGALGVASKVKRFVKEDSLTVKCVCPKGKYVFISYNKATDLYDVKVIKISSMTFEILEAEEMTGVFAEDLANFF